MEWAKVAPCVPAQKSFDEIHAAAQNHPRLAHEQTIEAGVGTKPQQGTLS